MVRELDWSIDVIVVPTVREPDGLALSSRNVYLGPDDRREAVGLSEALGTARSCWLDGVRHPGGIEAAMRERLGRRPAIAVDYIAIVDDGRFEPVVEVNERTIAAVAGRVGPTRLIDNISLGERVAALVERWAGEIRVSDAERARWLRAAWLHDAMRDAPLDELTEWAPEASGPKAIRHGPAAANRAAAAGESDAEVLLAVRYHSVGHADFGPAGRALYCADYLDPGRKLHTEPLAALAARYPADPGRVLFAVAQQRVAYLIQSGWTIPEPTYHFWNRLTLAAGSLPS